MRIFFPLFIIFFIAQASAHAENVPQSLDEAFSALDKMFTQEEKEKFIAETEEKATLNEHQFGLGLTIRNEWLRAGKSPLSKQMIDLGARNYDDISSMILTSYWRKLHNKPLDLEKQGACYKKWFEESSRLRKEAGQRGSDSYQMPDFNCP